MDAQDRFASGPPGAGPRDDNSELLSRVGSFILGFQLIASGVISIYALIAIWPAVEAATTADSSPATVHLFGIAWQPTNEVALLLLVTIASALGASLHAVISFTDYMGNRRLARSWVWWYALRVFVGIALAVLFYFALRGGLFSASTPTDVINPFGIAALAGLVGLFSKQATDKLREIFDTMFRTAPGQGDDQRGDSIVNPRPVVGGAEPARVEAGAAVLVVTLEGEGFIPHSIVRVSRRADGRGPFMPRLTEYRRSDELAVRLEGEDLAVPGRLYLTVVNPGPGGGRSGAAELEIHGSAAETGAVAAAVNPNGGG